MPGLPCKLFSNSMFPCRYVFEIISTQLIVQALVCTNTMVASFSRMSSRLIVVPFPISLIEKPFRQWYVFRYEYEAFPAGTAIWTFGACATSLLVCHDWLEPHDMTTKQSRWRSRRKSYSDGNPHVAPTSSTDRLWQAARAGSTRDAVPNSSTGETPGKSVTSSRAP